MPHRLSTFGLVRVRAALDTMRAAGLRTTSTAELIRALIDSFIAAAGCSAASSPNAQFGKWLSKHATELGIVVDRRNVRIKDDVDRRTTTAYWRI